MTTAQKPGQQQLAAPYRSFDRGTALARRIIGNHALVPLELLPSDVALVLVFEQNIPFGHWATHPTPHALAAFLDAHLALVALYTDDALFYGGRPGHAVGHAKVREYFDSYVGTLAAARLALVVVRP